MSLHNVERFSFDRIFVAPPQGAPRHDDRDDPRLELAALRAEVAALRTDMDARTSVARAEGFEVGLAQARAERETALLSAVDALQAGIEAIDSRFGEVQTRLTGEATMTALAAADLLAGRAIEIDPTAAIDDAIGRTLMQVARGTELQIRVHPDIAEAVEQRIADRQAQDRRKLNLAIVPDASLPPGDAQIEWDSGSLALDAASRRAVILSELEALLPRTH